MSYQSVNAFGPELSDEVTVGDVWHVSTVERVRDGNALERTDFYVVTGIHERRAGTAIYLTPVPSMDASEASGRGYNRGKMISPNLAQAARVVESIYRESPKGKSGKRHIIHEDEGSAYCFVTSERGDFSQLKPAQPAEGSESSLVARPLTDSAAWVSTFKPTPRAA